jgi:L-alanine-DL-glutamate epimerase-like enolase superfamily enzyme
VSAAWERLAGLPLRVEAVGLERLSLPFPQFERVTTHWRLRGGGEEGVGEDVCYAPEEHDALHAAGPPASLAGEWTLGAFCEHVESLDLFPEPPEQAGSRHYRVWAVESAALDLALRQAGASLHEHLGLEPRPVTFVCSMRFDPEAADPLAPLRRRLEIAPGLRFKLDAQSWWTAAMFDELRALGCVESFDLKGMYAGTVVDQPPDPELYRRCAEDFPEALLEDPRLTDETDPVLRPHRRRITWDAPIHGIADIEALPFAPEVVNVKPSRIGPLRELLATYAWCEERGIRMYSGGQTELGVGRGHIQLLASLFHPDTGNDVAPGGFNLPEPPDDLPGSPLDPAPDAVGFRRLG